MTQVTLPPSRFPAVKPLFLLPPGGPSSCADRKGGLRPTLSPARPFGLFCVFVSGPVMDVSFFGKFRSLTRTKDISSTLSPNSTPTPAFFVPSRMQQVTSCEKKMHFPSCTLPSAGYKLSLLCSLLFWFLQDTNRTSSSDSGHLVLSGCKRRSNSLRGHTSPSHGFCLFLLE